MQAWGMPVFASANQTAETPQTELEPQAYRSCAGVSRLRASLGNRRMAVFGEIGTIRTYTGYRLIRWYLRQQLGRPGRVAHSIVCNLNGPYLRRVVINAQVHLASLPPVFSPVFLAFPFAFARKLGAGAVYPQIKRFAAAAVRQLHLQCSLAAA